MGSLRSPRICSIHPDWVSVRMLMDRHPERCGRWSAMATLSPIRPIWAVWQPHTYRRTKALLGCLG